MHFAHGTACEMDFAYHHFGDNNPRVAIIGGGAPRSPRGPGMRGFTLKESGGSQLKE